MANDARARGSGRGGIVQISDFEDHLHVHLEGAGKDAGSAIKNMSLPDLLLYLLTIGGSW